MPALPGAAEVRRSELLPAVLESIPAAPEEDMWRHGRAQPACRCVPACAKRGGVKPRYNSRQKRDADGKRLCKVCEGPIPPRRSAYCGYDCALRNNPGWLRQKIWRRDKGVCAQCGLDTSALAKTKRGFSYLASHVWEMDHIVPVAEGGGLCGPEGYRTLCRKCHGKESGELRKRLNERKRLEKIQRETGKLF